MAEPISSSAAAYIKMFGVGLILTLAILFVNAVVLMTRMPRTRQEWAVGLISTVVSSLALGSAVIIKLGLLTWIRVTDPVEMWVGMVAIGGVLFTCGLPGWALIRWTFNFINAREGATIIDVIKEIKDEVRK